MTVKTSSTMHIGELAERTGLSLRTIRHYDDVGLLPATARTDGGFRVYSEDDLERLLVIKQMKPLGFSLEEMAEILELLSHSGSHDGNVQDSNVKDRQVHASSIQDSGGQDKLAGYLEKAIQERAKLARNLAQADELISRLNAHS